jgi:hypothetical protein
MTIYFRYNNYEEVNDIEERCSGGSKNVTYREQTT